MNVHNYNHCAHIIITVELNPDAKTVIDHDEYATREGLSSKGYMKLIGRQEPTAGRYAKAHQTRIDGVDGKPSLYYCLSAYYNMSSSSTR